MSGELEYPWQQPPEEGQWQVVTDDLWWARLKLPFVLDHINVFWLAEAGGVLIDTGLNLPHSASLWGELLGALPEMPQHLLLTHYHPDHVGFAGPLQKLYGLSVWQTHAEDQMMHQAYGVDGDLFATEQVKWMKRHGVDASLAEAYLGMGNPYRKLVAEPPVAIDPTAHEGASTLLAASDWQILIGHGHSPAMISLYNPTRKLLISADQVLPSISPNISLNFYSEDLDPLASYLASLAKFLAVPDDVLVLPSHGLPFRGLHQRIAELHAHHLERLERVLNSSELEHENSASTAQMLPIMFRRKLDEQQLIFALGECLAHLDYLVGQGVLSRETLAGADGTDQNGRIRYFKSGAGWTPPRLML